MLNDFYVTNYLNSSHFDYYTIIRVINLFYFLLLFPRVSIQFVSVNHNGLYIFLFFFFYENNYSLSCRLIECIHRLVLMYKRNSNHKHFCISNLLQPSESLNFFTFRSNIFYLLRPNKARLTKFWTQSCKSQFHLDEFKGLENVSSWKKSLHNADNGIVIGIRRLTINRLLPVL